MPTAYSHSRLSTYETCPLQYKYRYIDRVKVDVETTVEAFLGDMVHRVLEKLYSDLRYEKRQTLDEVLELYNRIWKDNWTESIAIVKKDYAPDNYRRMGEKYIRDYYARHHPFEEGRILGLETQDRLQLDDEGRYSFHIRIDRLMDGGNGLYEVHDYKTGQSLPAQEDLDKDRQLAVYSLWVRNRFKDFKQVRLVWHWLAFDKMMESTRTDAQLEALKEEVLASIRRVESAEEFPAHVGPLCGWCLFRSLCPMWKHEAELSQKPENEYLSDPGVRLVDEYVRVKKEWEEFRNDAEEKLERLKEALILFSDRSGVQVVVGTENRITLRTVESLKFPGKNSPRRAELVARLEERGLLAEVSDLDVKALDRAVEAEIWGPEITNRIRELGTREKTVRLSVSKK